MSDRSSFIREYAQIHGINLLMNVIDRLKTLETKLQTIVVNWQETRTLALENQVTLISGTSADDMTSKYLVHKLSLLNNHLLSEFPHKEYALKLTQDCLNAIFRAIQSNSYIWSKAQLRALILSLGSAYVIKSKGMPYFDNIGEEKEEKEEKDPYVLEYKENKKFRK